MSVLQAGQVTPGHICSWATDGVIEDSGVTFSNTFGMYSATTQGINFNSANTDNQILINLPVGYTRYRIHQIILSGATATLTTATCGVFTSTAGGGTAIVTSGTAITVSQTSGDTVNNLQTFTINNQATVAWIDTVIYFRVQSSQGSPALGNVSVFYQPLP
jgi:hypothetical protein